MARHDYKCLTCNKVFEVEHSILDSPTIMCTTCNKVAARLLNTGLTVIFNGPGFYETDYKDKTDDK